jgi:nitric oxide reductase activation protein
VRKRYPDLMRAIRHRFAQLRPMAPRRVRGVASGDDLDLEGMVAAVIDRRSGSASDDRLHVRRDPLERDVAAAFLLDMSASTSLALPEAHMFGDGSRDDSDSPPVVDAGTLLYGVYGSPPDAGNLTKRRRVIDVAKDSLALMAEGLATLGDTHAIYGFSGSGRDNVEFHIAKEFGEPVRRAVWAALAAIEPRGSTRMGPAIRHAATKLARQPSPLRLLILVSDGYPQDTDYGPDRNSEEYGIQDTAQALREAERAGIATFCVTIDPGGHDYLRRMCSPERYRVIDDVAALPAALGEIYAGLTSRGG